MKFFKYAIAIVAVLFIAFTVIYKKPNINLVSEDKTPSELCFARFGEVSERGFYDRYTLRLNLDGESARGELKFLPAEKDSKVGKFEGTVGAVDKIMMARRGDVLWDTLAEGMNTKEELKFIFGEGVASIGFGEMMDRGDGVYVYKNKDNVSYNLELMDVACSDLTERENVEKYLKDNISAISPVKEKLGGKWYVLSYTLDVQNNAGTVTYEDGHTQEKRTFSYSADVSGVVTGLVIK